MKENFDKTDKRLRLWYDSTVCYFVESSLLECLFHVWESKVEFWRVYVPLKYKWKVVIVSLFPF
jgi:hypothetical protein